MWHSKPCSSRFHIPLIKPDVRISRIRLSDKVIYVFAHGRRSGNPDRPSLGRSDLR